MKRQPRMVRSSTSGTSGVSGASGMASHGRGHASEIPASGRDNVSATRKPRGRNGRRGSNAMCGAKCCRVTFSRVPRCVVCIPYVLFIAVLMFLYIANGYHIQKLHRRHDRISEQIKELRSRSLTLSSIRMTATRQSEIIKELEARGIPLQESLTPPKIIDK